MQRLIISASLFLFPLIVFAEHLYGTLALASPLELSTPRSGMVREVLVSAGQHVERGAVLVRLEQRNARSHLTAADLSVAAARAAMEEADRELERTQELYDRTLLADHDLQLAKIALIDAKAHYQKALVDQVDAQLAVEYSELRAPFPALILATRVQVGQTVVNRVYATPMVFLARSDILRVTADATPEQIASLKQGQALKVRVDEREVSGSLVQIGLLPDQDSEPPLYPLEVEISWPPTSNWRAGQAAEIVLP
jgi:RND family efflux transporter MFP subunit